MTEARGDELTVRHATLADFDALVAAHGEVFAGTMGVALGIGYRRAFVGRFIRDPQQIAIIARRGETLVGYVLGRAIGAPDNTLATKMAAFWGLILHPWLVFRPEVRREVAAKAFRRRVPQVDLDQRLETVEGDLVGIGCIPGERGRGTAKALMEAFATTCHERGWYRLSLSVYRKNESARALYRSCGYVEIDHPGKPDVVYEFLDSTVVTADD